MGRAEQIRPTNKDQKANFDGSDSSALLQYLSDFENQVFPEGVSGNMRLSWFSEAFGQLSEDKYAHLYRMIQKGRIILFLDNGGREVSEQLGNDQIQHLSVSRVKARAFAAVIHEAIPYVEKSSIVVPWDKVIPILKEKLGADPANDEIHEPNFRFDSLPTPPARNIPKSPLGAESTGKKEKEPTESERRLALVKSKDLEPGEEERQILKQLTSEVLLRLYNAVPGNLTGKLQAGRINPYITHDPIQFSDTSLTNILYMKGSLTGHIADYFAGLIADNFEYYEFRTALKTIADVMQATQQAAARGKNIKVASNALELYDIVRARDKKQGTIQ